MAESWTVLKILKWTADYFGGHGLSSPRLDAELLLADTLGFDRVGLYVNFDRPLEKGELARYRDRVRRRVQHEPVQYILGKVEFWSLSFKVDASVLIPRPDTEVLVEEALAVLSGNAFILEVGTGSGAIAIALAHEGPEFQIKALEISSRALETAMVNARTHRVEPQIEFCQGDLSVLPDGPFDLIVSNPPYIPSGDLQGLMPEIRDHEPRVALDGGNDGLNAIRLLAAQTDRCLKPGGWLMLEVGIGQAEAVTGLFESVGLEEIHVRNDYAGIPRVVAGRKKV